MFLIVGLGNPGKKFEQTRHNMGFLTVDTLAQELGIAVNKIKFKGLLGEGRIGTEKVLLLKPQTYMNLSGESVREAVTFYKLAPQQLLVVYDDIDIPLGNLRIRKSGSAGTHNGMRSVVYQLQSDQFPRIRIGIGSAESGALADFVTGKMTAEERSVLADTIQQAARATQAIVTEGIDQAMNQYNTRKTNG